MNINYLNSTKPLDTTYPFGSSTNLRLTNFVVEEIAHVKDLIVTGRANGVARVMEYTEAPVNAVAYALEADLNEQPTEGDTLTITQGDYTFTWTFMNSASAADHIEIAATAALTADNIVEATDSEYVTVTNSTTTILFTAAQPGTLGIFTLGGTGYSTEAIEGIPLNANGTLVDAVDATPGQLGTTFCLSDVQYVVSSLDAYNNPVWQQHALSALA